MQLIKVFGEEAKESLESRGFFVISKEKINGLEVFTFEKTDELEKVLYENYSEIKFVQENKLRFV